MNNGMNLTYKYDSSFEGFLCCVFESYVAHEMPAAIIGAEDHVLFDAKEIITDMERAGRVSRSIAPKISPEAEEILRHAFLTCLPEKELHMLKFIRLGYRYGGRFLQFAGNETVWRVTEAVKKLRHEAHLLTGFIRFSVQGGALVSTIGPKNFVLPLIAGHFKNRFPEERILIYDEKHHAAFVYRPYESAIIPMDDFTAAPPDLKERKFRELWRAFYDTIEIRQRHNELCRRTLLPMRYWKYMTEFTSENPVNSSLLRNH